MLQEKSLQVSKKWKLINYRVTKDLLTAEFLHDLYNRHRPEVNSIRFRNTLCILRGEDFRSYAPQDEWNYLGKELGRRFYLREARLLEEVKHYIGKEKRNLNGFLKTFPADLSASSEEELYALLSKLHYLALGDIYGINLVQIEHGLNWAISRHLPNHAEDFSILPTFEWDSQLKLLEKGLIEASLQITEENRPLGNAYEELCLRFGHFRNGYGSGVDSREKIKEQLEDLLRIKPELRRALLIPREVQKRAPVSEYVDLYEIASQIAELRDKNKLLMGLVTAKRDAVLEMIAVRKGLSRSEISRYSLLEISHLIYQGELLRSNTIQERHHLVIFKREECFVTNVRAEALFRDSFEARTDSEVSDGPVYGTIASKGVVQGRARIVFSHKDCDDIKKTDILVALGTDFDLLHGIAACGGIITEEGGILSHASVVSRELGKPCLIGVAQLLTSIQEGDQILLNCDEGYLKIIPPSTVALEVGMELLCKENLSSHFPAKIFNLNRLAKQGFPILEGICIPESFLERDLDSAFFKKMHKIFAHFLHANTLIVRGCLRMEDQAERSFAGASCSRVVKNEPSSLKTAFKEVKSRKIDLTGVSLLIQPFLQFECGGVAFTDRSAGKILLEMSVEGPFGVVNGKVDQRLVLEKDLLEQKWTKQTAPELAALAAYEIAELFGYDVDVEWGIEKGKLWILQARPVTIACVY
jgi:phosphohistidine swiveling domain-containing protein